MSLAYRIHDTHSGSSRNFVTWLSAAACALALLLITSIGWAQVRTALPELPSVIEFVEDGQGEDTADDYDPVVKKRKARADLSLPVVAPLGLVDSLLRDPDPLHSVHLPLPEVVLPGSIRDPGLRVARGQAPPT